MQLEALAQEALREGLSKEQVAYEQWVDTQPIESVMAWDEMGVGERTAWIVEYMESCGGEGDGELEVRKASDDTASTGEVQRVEEEQTTVEHTSVEERGKEAMGDLGEESRWRAVRTVGREDIASHAEKMVVVEQEESLPILPGMFFYSRSRENIRFKWTTYASDLGYCTVKPRLGRITDDFTGEPSVTEEPSTTTDPTPTPEPHRQFRASARAWTATTHEDSSIKNKPQCPPCARLKRTWTRCRGGPPCIECQHRGLSAEQCQSYDLLNRSRKNRLKKKDEACKKMDAEPGIQCGSEGEKEDKSAEDVLDGKEGEESMGEVTGEMEGGGSLDAEEVAQ
jgi:hypothetical protein